MTKTYNVADYAMHTGTQLVIIAKDFGPLYAAVWVHFVNKDGDHNGVMRLISKSALSNFRTAELLA